MAGGGSGESPNQDLIFPSRGQISQTVRGDSLRVAGRDSICNLKGLRCPQIISLIFIGERRKYQLCHVQEQFLEFPKKVVVKKRDRTTKTEPCFMA